MAAPEAGAADRLAAAVTAVLCAMPAALVVASRSSPLVLAVAVVLGALSVATAHGPAALLRTLSPPRTPVALVAAAGLALALASLSWSAAPGVSARALAEFAAALVGGFALARLVGPGLGSRLGPAALGLVVGAVLLLGSLISDFALQRLAGLRTDPSSLNRAALALVILALPVADGLTRRGHPAAATGLAALVGVAAFRSESATAALAWLAAVAAWAAARLLPRAVSLTVARAALIAALVLAPLAGDLLARGMPERAERLLASANVGGRIAIARSFGAAVAADPWRGLGFGASPRADAAPVAAGLDPELRVMLAAGHPHNAALQVWAEMGVAGAALALAAALLVVEAMTTLSRADLAPRLALLAAVTAALLVGHGAWQGWWAAVVGAALVWQGSARRHGPVRQEDRAA